MPINDYEILGLKPNASEREIKQAYFKKSLEHHPDKGGKTEDFQNIYEAYCSLKKNKEENNIENTGDRDSRTNNNSQSNSLEIERWRAENPANNNRQEVRNDYPDVPFTPPFPDIYEGMEPRKAPTPVSIEQRIKELEEEIEHAKKKLNLSLTEGQRKEVEDYIRGLEELLGLFKNELCENREEQLEWEVGWLKRKKPNNPKQKQEVEEEIRKKEQELANLKNSKASGRNEENKNQQRKSQLEQEIRDLENKPNKNEQEEQDLNNKKEELKDLVNSANNDSKRNWIKPTALIVVGLLVVIILIVKIKKKQKKRKIN